VKIVVQRVSRASVRVEKRVVGEIGRGLLLLVGVEKGDTQAILDTLADKVVNLRCSRFPNSHWREVWSGDGGPASRTRPLRMRPASFSDSSSRSCGTSVW
jgi:D-tyrosyl-tRNA(Tyr) deacylase